MNNTVLITHGSKASLSYTLFREIRHINHRVLLTCLHQPHQLLSIFRSHVKSLLLSIVKDTELLFLYSNLCSLSMFVRKVSCY